jgi:hypothetical protein
VVSHIAGMPLTIVRAKETESERQLRDVVGVLMVQGDAVDRTRIERWVSDLDLEDVWRQALEMEQSERGVG